MTGVADGDYVVHLVASRAGEPFEDEVRLTLLNAQITEPAPLTAIGRQETVDVVGTAAGGGFVSYLLEYRRPSQDPPAWQTAGLAPEGAQTTPVRHGLLGTLDVSGLTEGDRFDFRLTVTTSSGVVTKSSAAGSSSIRRFAPAGHSSSYR